MRVKWARVIFDVNLMLESVPLDLLVSVLLLQHQVGTLYLAIHSIETKIKFMKF